MYNWMKALLEDYYHSTQYGGECSTVAAVQASVTQQGSGLDPASFIVKAADLYPVTSGNCTLRFADDTWWYQQQTQVLDYKKYHT